MNDLKSYIAVRRCLKEFNPDIIHLHSTKASIVFRFLKLSLDCSIFYTVHGWGFTSGTNIFWARIIKFVERCTKYFITKFILVSQHDVEMGYKSKVLHKRSSLLIYNSYSPSMQNVVSSQVLTRTPGKIRAIMVARLDKQKDHITLLKAIKNVSNIELFLVGDGPKKMELESFSKSIVQPNVHFLGRRSDVGDILRSMDVFLLISNYEGFPISTLEAMSCSLPVIVSDVGGAAEVLNFGDFGFKVGKGNVKELADILKWCTKHPNQLKEMGKVSKSVVESYFNEYTMIEQLDDAYMKDVVNY
jgi:glycosyltransferase involved in cell wall biosynthesis